MAEKSLCNSSGGRGGCGGKTRKTYAACLQRQTWAERLERSVPQRAKITTVVKG